MVNIPLTFEKSPLLINALSKVSFSSSIPFWFISQVNRHLVLFAFSTFVHLGIIGNWFPSFRFSIEERISSKAMPQSLNYIMNKWKGCKQALQTEKSNSPSFGGGSFDSLSYSDLIVEKPSELWSFYSKGN